jgi:beta-barrel assembly-enhancing protease
MKSTAFTTGVLLALCIACPATVSAVQSEENWRKRISSEYDTVAMSDITEEIRFGREVAARIIGRYGLYENLQIMKYVNLVGQALAQGTNRPELEFHFAVLNSDEINAFSAPGGYVFVTQGALRAMGDEAELAGVLAHELGHISEKHAVKELKIRSIESAAASSLPEVIVGSSDPARVAFRQAVDKAMNILLRDGYKRHDEIQADMDALLFCAMAGYEPEGLMRFVKRLDGLKGNQTETFDKTHPPLKDRVDWLKAALVREGIDSGEYRTYRNRFTENMKAMTK